MNVLLDKGQLRCKVADLGGSRAIQHRRTDSFSASPVTENKSAPLLPVVDGGGDGDAKGTPPVELMMTAAVGTPQWAAPELFAQRCVVQSYKTDIYSLAIVFWELLTFESPWGTRSGYAAWGAAAEGRRPAIEEAHLADAPPKFVALIEEMWGSDAQQRPSAGRVVARVRSMAVFLGIRSA